jgi:hypothetical protein
MYRSRRIVETVGIVVTVPTVLLCPGVLGARWGADADVRGVSAVTVEGRESR